MHNTTIICQFGLLSQAYQPISPSILIHFWGELYQQETMVPPVEPPEEPMIQDANGIAADIPEDLSPEHHPAPHLPCPQPAQTIPTAR